MPGDTGKKLTGRIDMTAIEQFKQAAAALQQEEVYLAFQQARKASDEDAQLQGEIGEFTRQRTELAEEMEKQEQDKARVEELNRSVSGLYASIVQNPNMQAFDKAKGDVESFVGYINDILNAAIMGEDPLLVQPREPSSGCPSNGCSGCSGCG